MVIGDTLTLESLRAPEGVELLDDPETVIATLTPPKLQLEEEEEIEEETEVVGEGEEGAEGEGEAARSGDGGEGEATRGVAGRPRAGLRVVTGWCARRLAARRTRQSRRGVRRDPPQHRL